MASKGNRICLLELQLELELELELESSLSSSSSWPGASSSQCSAAQWQQPPKVGFNIKWTKGYSGCILISSDPNLVNSKKINLKEYYTTHHRKLVIIYSKSLILLQQAPVVYSTIK